MRAATPYVWMPEPTIDEPQAAAAVAVSFDLKNSSLVSAAFARWYVSPKRGARTAADEAWVKMTPRAIAEGLTGGRSDDYGRQQDDNASWELDQLHDVLSYRARGRELTVKGTRHLVGLTRVDEVE